MTAAANIAKLPPMTTFKFGALSLDAPEFASQGTAILGIRDSGKTYTATAMAEKLFDAGVPFVAFDPIGVWRYLRVPGEGRGGRGFPIVVAGGAAGDLPLTPATAPAIVEAAMREGVSLVIDLFHMDLSKADWRRIVRDSVKLLLHKNKPHGLRHVFLEEAAEFAPQRVIDGDVYAEVEKLARMGGNSRLGYTLINQRAEEVNKAVLELCDNLFLHRQKGRNSLVALGKWLDVGGAREGKALLAALPTLPQGECYAWLAGSDTPRPIKVPKKASLHPDRRTMRGDDDAAAPKAIDVGAFVAAMTDALPKLEAEAAANDPKKLQAEIARLRRELAAAQGFEDGKAEGFNEALEKTRAALGEVQQRAIAAPKAAPRKAIAPPPQRPARPSPPVRVTVKAPPPDSVSGPMLRLLEALAFWEAIGIDAPSNAQIAVASRYSPTSSSFANTRGALKSAGLVDYPSPGHVALTDAGRAIAPEPEDGTVRDRLGAILTGPQIKFIDALPIDGAAMSNDELAAATGYSVTSSSFANTRGSLRSLDIISYPSPGHVAIEPWVWIA